MNIVVALYSALLFFILSPGVLLRIPSNGSKFTVAFVHALVFGVALYFTQKIVWQYSVKMHHEGFQEGVLDKKKKKR
jgi:uncharacterized membrane protein YdbT with pleckstrin-like domain